MISLPNILIALTSYFITKIAILAYQGRGESLINNAIDAIILTMMFVILSVIL